LEEKIMSKILELREKRLAALDAQMNQPTSAPILSTPHKPGEPKTG
jgi:hypothetical protein